MSDKSLYHFFRSLRLAIGLILFITLTSIISTFIPQKQEPEFYLETYSHLTAWFIDATGYDNFFKSLLFLVPSFLFFINLSTCTFHRFRTRLKNKARMRYGPDILHIGLLVLIIGGLVSVAGRKEGFTMLLAGDSVNIPGGYVLTLEDFEFLTYETGAPRDWISTVRVEKGEELIHSSFPIEVNKPLKIGNAKIYQSSYDIQSFIVMSDPDGKIYKLSVGEMIPVDDRGYILKSVERDEGDVSKSIAHFDYWKGRDNIEHQDYGVSDSIHIYTIDEMKISLATGLQMVIDPGYYPILIGLLLLTLGLFITYIQKMGENKL